MQKIKSISQRSDGWSFAEILLEIICTVKTEHLTLEINLLLSQIVLLAILYQVFTSACFLHSKEKNLLPTQEPVNTMLERKCACSILRYRWVPQTATQSFSVVLISSCEIGFLLTASLPHCVNLRIKQNKKLRKGEQTRSALSPLLKIMLG